MVGDALNGRYRVPRPPLKMTSTDLTQAIDSIRKLAKLDFDILCFGHGQPLTEGVYIKMQELMAKIED